MDVVTVFGASGFIGRYVVGEIAKSGSRVRAAVRRPDRASFLKPMGDVGQVTPVAANIRDDASVAAAVEGADIVINLVGILFPGKKQTFESLQVDGAQRVAQAAKAAGAKRLVQVSAIGADAQSGSAYASSKGIGEQIVREAFPGATVVRPSIVFGPEDDFLNRFATLAIFSPALPLIGGGHTKLQPVYVGDVADAITSICQDPKTAGATYELGGPQVRSFRELMEIVLKEIDRKRLLVPLPFPIATAQASILELIFLLPQMLNLGANPPVTVDQIKLLRHDNVVTGDLPGLEELGIDATALETIVPAYLRRYRRGVWHT
ncbi:MAG: complex I NDUFA9 subunit family protein [Rhodospirillaceae bacterium]|nr:complex I NDUFA9 subunit family protein [Rhodospirillaceae bacterium]